MQNYSDSAKFAKATNDFIKLGKRIFYTYNPDTDNFERFFPTMKNRLISHFKLIGFSLVIAACFVVIFNYIVVTPNEKNLILENRNLRTEYKVLTHRVDEMIEVMNRISERDDNFYRVMMQMEPMSDAQRLAGLANNNYQILSRLSDSKLVALLSQRMNLLESKIYSQIQSFNQLKIAISDQEDKLMHVPAIMPINIADYTMSSGYGWRRDPIYGFSKFHEGLDFAASTGTDVFATADGIIAIAGHQTGYGLSVEIDHGYNYLTRYAHLSKVLVKQGEKVKRGQLIGKVGSTGKSTGPHLHYEVRFKNLPQNPVNYYFMDVTPEQYNEIIQLAENAGHVMD